MIKELEDSNNRLLEANKKMFAALNNLENDDNKIPQHAWMLIEDAINDSLF